MKQYLELCERVMRDGVSKDDRTGTGTRSVFGHQMRFNLADGFPLVTTKKLHMKSIIHELIWFISGSTNIGYLKENGVKIWDEWADADGNLGPVYGAQWRGWVTEEGLLVDQLQNVIDQIKSNPDSRRLIVSAWNVGEIDNMALPPCHTLFQFYVADRKLSCQLYQRSGDVFLGIPFNIASMSLLTHMIAHIYSNHFDQVMTQLERTPKALPRLVFRRKITSIDHFTYDDIQIIGYDPDPHIKGEVAI